MSEERFDNIYSLYRNHENDEDLVNMIAELRDEFLNY